MNDLPPNDTCVSIIFNPTSGKDNAEKRQDAIRDALSTHGYACQFLVTTKERGAKEAAAEALKSGANLIVVSGGDGTVMEVFSALVGSDVPAAVLPAGTGNLLAINLGIPLTLPEATKRVFSGTPHKIDLAKTDDGRYFAIMGGIGMDAQLIHDADRESKNRLGVFAYFAAAWKNRLRRRTWMDIQLDDAAPLRRKAKSVLVANMGKITGGLQAVPTADPTNGSLEVSIITVKNSWQWLRLLGYAVVGKTHQDPRVDVLRAKRVTIRADQDERVQFDGEDGGMARELSVQSVPSAVSVII